jgi:branched-chain amino acid transport system ATP-binding protein
LLEVEGLAAGYLGERVVDGIDLEVRTGEAVAIVGSNGAGKTTLFRAIAGLLPTMAGRVVLDGKELTRRPAHRISRAGIAYVPAERHLFPGMTLKTNLVLGAYPRRPDPETLELVYHLFPRLHERQRQQAGTLSGGEQQMLAVGPAVKGRGGLSCWGGGADLHGGARGCSCSTSRRPVSPRSSPRSRSKRSKD